MAKKPKVCIGCRSRECEKTKPGTFDTCKYGIAFLNKGSTIEKREPKIPVSKISKNLRHEINPVLQVIIEQVSEIDNTLSTKRIDPDKPLSKIIGSTVILDIFIQMISGVNEFHYLDKIKKPVGKSLNLKDTVKNYFNIYSILQEKNRAKGLALYNGISGEAEVNICSDFINYIIAVLIDNSIKYSKENSVVRCFTENKTDKRIDLVIENYSEKIDNGINIFELGVKADEGGKGFGFGLFWAKNLEDHYNNLTENISKDVGRLEITHKEIKQKDKGLFVQRFKLKNILIDEE